jgi:hypothetical protein
VWQWYFYKNKENQVRNIKMFLGISIISMIYTICEGMKGKHPDQYLRDNDDSTTPYTKDSPSTAPRTATQKQPATTENPIDTHKDDGQDTSDSIKKDEANPFVYNPSAYTPNPTPTLGDTGPKFKATKPQSQQLDENAIYTKTPKSVEYYAKKAKDLIKKFLATPVHEKSESEQLKQNEKDKAASLKKIERSLNDIEMANKRANSEINAAVKKLQKTVTASFEKIDIAIEDAPSTVKNAFQQLEEALNAKIITLQDIVTTPEKTLQILDQE